MQERTLYFYLIIMGFLGGVLLRSFLFINNETALLGVVVAMGLLLVGYRALKLAKSPSLGQPDSVPLAVICIALLLGASACGVWRFGVAEATLIDAKASLPVGETITLSGIIVRAPDVRANATLLTLATEDTRVLLTTDRHTTIAYGDTVEVTGKLAQPTSFVTDFAREFDYAGYLEARGITHTMAFVTPVVITPAPTVSLVGLLYQGKQYFLERLALVLPEPAMGLSAGLLLGVQSALGEEIETAFRVTGIIHIVVLSGYNIMLVVAFVMYVLAFLLPFRARLVVGIGAVILFALLVGYSPSVLRASTMAILFLVAMLLARPYLILRMLVLSAGIMVAVNPYLLRFDIGFQLSFMATLGLVLVAPQLEATFTKVTTWLSLRSFLVATIATQIAVAPLLLYHIGQWSLVAVPVNLLVLPMVPVAMLLTFLTGLVALLSTTLTLPLAFLAYLSLEYIITSATLVAAWPYAAVTIPPFSPYLLPLAYAGLGYVWYRYFYQRESHLLVTMNNNSEELGSEWIIVEEATLLTDHAPNQTEQKVGTASTTPTPKDTPIFFR